MDADVLLPAQIRAARGLLGWSQERLAEAAAIGLSTVRDFEAMRGAGSRRSLAAMRRALEAGGARFIAGSGEVGAGVCLAEVGPQILRQPSKLTAHGHLPFEIVWRGRKLLVLLAGSALDALDKVRHRRSEAELVMAFLRHRASILDAAARALAAGRVTPDERVYLSSEDFPRAR